MEDRYVIRRFVALGTGYGIEDGAVSAVEAALLKALLASESCIGVAVIDPNGKIMQHFGHIPADLFEDCRKNIETISFS